jgi:hypothetical protein
VTDDLVAGLFVDATKALVLLGHEPKKARARPLVPRNVLEALEQGPLGLWVEGANVEPDRVAALADVSIADDRAVYGLGDDHVLLQIDVGGLPILENLLGGLVGDAVQTA